MVASKHMSFAWKASALLVLLCSMALLACVLPAKAHAEVTVLGSGMDGNISWRAVYDSEAVYDSSLLDEKGMRMLYLSGSGPMDDYDSFTNMCPGTKRPPWYTTDGKQMDANLHYYLKVEIGRGITSIGTCALCEPGLMGYAPKEIVIPDTVTSIGDYAFLTSEVERVVVPNSVTKIGKLVFNSKTKVVCKSDSAAFRYCDENDQLMEVTDLDLSFTIGGENPATIRKGQTLSYEIASNVPGIEPSISLKGKYWMLEVDQGNHMITATGSGGKAVATAFFHGAEWECPITILREIEDVDAGIESGTYAYTGKAKKPVPSVWYGDELLSKGTDFTLSYANNKNPGKATVTITGKGDYVGTKKLSFRIAKAAQPMKASGKTVSLKCKSLKKKSQSLKIGRLASVKKAVGKLSYKKTYGNKRIVVDKKTGKVTVKKKLGKGYYPVEIKITAAGDSKYEKGSVIVTGYIWVK